MPARLLLAVLTLGVVVGCAGSSGSGGGGGSACSQRAYNLPHNPCLAVASACQNRYETQYLANEFTCVKRRLRKVVKSAPGPSVTLVQMPAAISTPSGTRTISFAATQDSWQPGVLAAGADAMWLTTDELWRLAPGTNAVSKLPSTPGASNDVLVTPDAVWVDEFDANLVRRLDQQGHEVAQIKLGGIFGPTGMLEAFGSIWVAEHRNGRLTRIDPATNSVSATVYVGRDGLDGPLGMGATAGSLWVAVPNVNAVIRVDPASNEIADVIPFPGSSTGNVSVSPCGLVTTAAAVWVSMCGSNLVAKIDPASDRITAVYDVGGMPTRVAPAGDALWVGTGGDPDSTPDAPGYLVKLRADGTASLRYALGDGVFPADLAVAFGSIWVVDSKPRVFRIPTP